MNPAVGRPFSGNVAQAWERETIACDQNFCRSGTIEERPASLNTLIEVEIEATTAVRMLKSDSAISDHVAGADEFLPFLPGMQIEHGRSKEVPDAIANRLASVRSILCAPYAFEALDNAQGQQP
ncbi:MAG: hypothetical protein ACAH95_11770 [Fimbriimonas sp.]